MKTFTIRNIDGQEIITCDDDDLILRHCKGNRLYLHEGNNSLPEKVEFNLRLSKELVENLRIGFNPLYSVKITPEMVKKVIKKLEKENKIFKGE